MWSSDDAEVSPRPEHVFLFDLMPTSRDAAVPRGRINVVLDHDVLSPVKKEVALVMFSFCALVTFSFCRIVSYADFKSQS
jgi:hypothetical protein